MKRFFIGAIIICAAVLFAFLGCAEAYEQIEKEAYNNKTSAVFFDSEGLHFFGILYKY